MILLPNFSNIQPTPVLADLMVVDNFDNGVTLYNGTNLQMPEADAKILFTHNQSMNTIHFFGNYEVFTNITQNATFAFVYPMAWNMWMYDVFDTSNMSIHVNSIQIAYTLFNWTELYSKGFINQLNPSGSPWVSDASFAVFELELNANSTTMISVEMNGEFWGNPHDLQISYIFASAYSFESDTHQRINITVNEVTPVLEVDYWPRRYYSVHHNENVTSIIWDFMLDDFDDFDHVEVSLSIHRFTPYTTSPTTITTTSKQIQEVIGPIVFSVTFGVFVIACIVVLNKLRS
jgi:hypothetical protein